MPDQQIDPKDKEISDLKATVAVKDTVIAEKDRQIHGAGEIIDDLKKQVARAHSDAAAKDKQLEEAGNVVTELKSKLTELPVEVKADSHGQVKHGKDTYELTVPSFNHLGDIITHAVLKERPKLVDSLVADRVGFLRKVA